jgi:hypothetical protein
MIHRVEIAGIFLILGIINYISYVIYDKLAKRKFMTLCTLFVEKFGARPAEVLIYQDGGFFFSFMRDAFFIKALYFKENSFHTRGMDNEQIRFIKELPNQYTDWLRVKATFHRWHYFYIHDAGNFLLTIIYLKVVKK